MESEEFNARTVDILKGIIEFQRISLEVQKFQSLGLMRHVANNIDMAQKIHHKNLEELELLMGRD